jgi:hypothetical protein
LFSRKDVADYVNQHFESVWESVRPVPVVRIDFGNGKVLTRTLHGNIATYVCNADGQVLDILPGIYAPAPYLDALKQFRLLANYADQRGKDRRAGRLRDYHRGQAEALRKNEEPPTFFNLADISKTVIEGGIKAVLVGGGTSAMGKGRSGDTAPAKAPSELGSAEDLAHWKELAADTRQNESTRRRQIHELLAKAGLVRPEAVVKRLYREVLHADLDDPYLGLGPLLFGTYAFAKEDKAR